MCSLQNLKETKREKEKAIEKEREKINVCGKFHIMNRSKIFNVCSVWNSQRGFFLYLNVVGSGDPYTLLVFK